jgi:mandelate racemase
MKPAPSSPKENFRALKIRLGRDKIKDDLKSIAEVRRAVGDDIIPMSDWNQGPSLSAAFRRLHQLDDQGLEWFEEPIVFDDFANSARLANELKTPLQIGENIYGPRHFLQAVAAGAKRPGMDRGPRAGFGLPLSPHLDPEFSAHLMRVTEPQTGWNGGTGVIHSWRSRMRSVAAPFIFRTGRALASRGTRPP